MRFIKIIKIVLTLLIFTVFLKPLYCENVDKAENSKLLKDFSSSIITSIKNYDMNTISANVNQDSGLDFIFIFPRQLPIYYSIKKDKITQILENENKIIKLESRTYSGYPILLSMKEFLDKFYHINWENSHISIISDEKFLSEFPDVNYKLRDKIIIYYEYQGKYLLNNGKEDYTEYANLAVILDKNEEKYYLKGIVFNVCEPYSSLVYANSKFKKVSDETENILRKKAKEIVPLIESKNFPKLAGYVHPEKGVKFTPNTRIGKNPPAFMKEELLNPKVKDRIIKTGYISISCGETTETLSDFIPIYIDPVDFSKPDKILFNQIVFRGNHMHFCWWEIFPEASMVNYHIDKKREEENGEHNSSQYNNWSLQLFFEEYKNDWYLVCVICYNDRIGWS